METDKLKMIEACMAAAVMFEANKDKGLDAAWRAAILKADSILHPLQDDRAPEPKKKGRKARQ